jgi:type II secretory pathway component PulJ
MSTTPIRSSCSKRRAFTLAEALLSLALVSLVLGLLTQIFASITRQDRALQQREQVINAALTALDRMSRDCRMAVVWAMPDAGDTTLRSVAEFDLPDYEQEALRLPFPPVATPTPSWNPEALLLRLRYRVDQQRLWREVRVAGAFQGISLCRGVSGMSIRRIAREDMLIELSLLVEGKLKTLHNRFRLPCPHTWATP